MGGGKAGKAGKGQNAPFEDPTTEQRYQRLLDQRRREGKPPISRARFSRQLTHTGGQRDPPTNVPNLRRSVDAPQTNPKSKARNTPAPPPARRQRTDYQQAERAQVEENSPSPDARPELQTEVSSSSQAPPQQVEEPSPEAGLEKPPVPATPPATQVEVPSPGHEVEANLVQQHMAGLGLTERAPQVEAQTDSTGKSSPGQLAPKLERQVEEASPPPSSPDSSSSSSQSEGQGPLKAEPSAGSPHNQDEYFSPETEEVTMVPLPKDEEPSPRPMAEPQDEVPSPGPAQEPQVSLAVLHKEVLRMPLSLSGQLKPHRGSPNAPWTYFVPDQLTDQLGRSWAVTGVGGSRITLEVPDDLGPGAGHQVLKLGPPESCLDEYRWFETLARDFQYVPRPSIKGEIQVTLEANGPLPGRAFTAFGAFFQKVEPIDRSPGSLRAVTEADLLFCLVCISHLAALYLRVADLGYHNLAWQVESLAVSRAENTHLTSQALRTRPFVPLVLIDGGRWTQGVQASFPGKAGTKGLFALCNRFPSFGEWVQQMVYSYSSAETLCKVFVRRLQNYPDHFEGLKNIGLITYLPLTYKPALYVPSESPWNDNEDEVVWRLVPIPGPETPA